MTDSTSKWLAGNWTKIGASHLCAGKPNQDSGAHEFHDEGRVLLAAVADGHGSRKCFRSERGAGFAVEAALETLRSYVGFALAGGERESALRRDAKVEIPQRIVRRWQQRVDDDLASAPPGGAELADLSEAERAGFLSNPRLAYGTTLVSTLILPTCALFLQLGDGDLLVVGGQGTEPSRPLPPDERSFANDTASLSSSGPAAKSKRPDGGSGPWADFRVAVVPMVADPPALILLTTDGYPNAFVNDAAFRVVATDLLAMARIEGWDFVVAQMPGWLEEASRQGSGDDVTVVVAVRAGLVGPSLPTADQAVKEPADLIGDSTLPAADHAISPSQLE